MHRVHNSLYRGPVVSQAIFLVTYVGEYVVNGVHGESDVVIPDGGIRCVGQDLHLRAEVSVDGRNLIRGAGPRTELAKTLHGHGVDGVCYRFIVVGRQAILLVLFVTD